MGKPNKPTPLLAIRAQCAECCGFYADGMVDCENTRCSLYNWMPFKKKSPNFDWMKYNPKRKGRVTWEDSARELTDEQRKILSDRLRSIQANKTEKNEDKKS